MNLFNYLMNKKGKKLVDNNHMLEYLLNKTKIKEKKRIIDGNNLNIKIKELNSTAPAVDSTDNVITRIIFDFWNNDYQTLLGNFSAGSDVSYDNDGVIRLFYNNTIVYILSDYIIETYNMNSMLRGFTEMTEINFDNFNTSNCTDMSLLFTSCSKLERQTGMENFDTSNCTNMSNMLRDIKLNTIGQDDTCTLNISNWDTSHVTDMSQMFRLNNAISIDISNFRTPVCSKFLGMFNGASSTRTINIENIDFSLCEGTSGSTGTNASDIFANCFSLENIIFGKNLGKGYVSSLSLYQASINLSQSNLLTHDSIMSVINNVETSLKIVKIYLGSTNYNKVTSEERAISYAKNWEAVFQSRN